MTEPTRDTVEAARERLVANVFGAGNEPDPQFAQELGDFETAIRADERSAMVRKAVEMEMHAPADCPSAQRGLSEDTFYEMRRLSNVLHAANSASAHGWEPAYIAALEEAVTQAMLVERAAPTAEEVERAYDVFWQTRALNSNANPRDNELESLRAALKAVR